MPSSSAGRTAHLRRLERAELAAGGVRGVASSDARAPALAGSERRAVALTAESVPGQQGKTGQGFQHEVRGKPLTHRLFVEVFAGTSRLAHTVAQAGVPAVSYEISRNNLEDVTSPACLAFLLKSSQSRRLACVWLATPCSSFSQARRGQGGKMPGALRTREQVLGLPGLSDRDQERVRLGNRLARWTCRFIKACLQSGIPVILENPAGSLLWHFPGFQRLAKQGRSIIYDNCQYGEVWRKRTRLVGWNVDLDSLSLRCKQKFAIQNDGQRKAVCSRTGAPHSVLSGPRAGAEWCTALASAYPWPLCVKVSELVVALVAPGLQQPRPVENEQASRTSRSDVRAPSLTTDPLVKGTNIRKTAGRLPGSGALHPRARGYGTTLWQPPESIRRPCCD